MTTDLRAMLVGQLLAGDGEFHHLDYWDVFQLESPATEEELVKALDVIKKIDFNADGLYELQLSANKEHMMAYVINCHRLLSAGIPTEQYFEVKP